jgi:uncharacterized protein
MVAKATIRPFLFRANKARSLRPKSGTKIAGKSITHISLSLPGASMLSLRRLVLLCAAPLSALSAQGTPASPEGPFREPPPAISASGRADVKVTPDRATIRISVQTRGSTAATAASENAKKQSVLLSSLRKLGFSNEQLSTSDYNVESQYRYEQNKDPILTGYTVTNTVMVDIKDVKQVGATIDAALGSGANMISSLDFYASNTTEARQQAITEAVKKARGEAEAAAKAAGGNLGAVIDITVSSDYQQPPRPMYAKAMGVSGDAATPITPGQETLTVAIFGRWKLVP